MFYVYVSKVVLWYNFGETEATVGVGNLVVYTI